MHEDDPVADVEEQQQSCSPRSMYSLATAVGIPYGYITPSADTLKAWDQQHQGGRTREHPIQAFRFQHCARTVYYLF